jgi:hypothetical protein
MKKIFFLLAVFMISITCSINAQVQCIYCYHQNDSISTGVNNLILNSGFENHNCIPQNWFSSSYCPNSSYYNCDITDWVCTGGGGQTYADIVTNAYAKIVDGTYAVYFGSSYCSACNSTLGDTSCVTDIGCTSTGIPPGYPQSGLNYGGTSGLSLEQTVPGLLPGTTYCLEFWAGGEGNQGTPGLFAVDVGFGDTLMRNNPTPYSNGIGTRFLIIFKAVNTSHTIRFTNWGHINNNATELILDDVRLYKIEELSSTVPSCNTSTGEMAIEQSFSLSPNPVSGPMIVTINSHLVGEDFMIMDQLGKTVMKGNLSSEITSIDLMKLSQGIYTFRIGNDNNGAVKIVKN